MFKRLLWYKKTLAVPIEKYVPVHPAPVFFWMAHVYTNHWREVLQPNQNSTNGFVLLAERSLLQLPVENASQ